MGLRKNITTARGLSVPVIAATRAQTPDAVVMPAILHMRPEPLVKALASSEVREAGTVLRKWSERGALTATATPLAMAISLSMFSLACLAGEFAGCYELQLSKWKPAMFLGEDEVYILPPSRIELTTTPDRTWEEHGLKVTPANGATPSIHGSSFWTSDAHRVHIVWTTGFSGLTMNLEEQGANLIGTAHTFWDFPRPEQTSDVVARKISCESKN